MNTNLLSWLLAGALLASLTWNLRATAEPEIVPAAPSCASDSSTCRIDSAELRLDPETLERVRASCASSCADAARLDREATERLRELRELLASEEASLERAEGLAAEVSDLRARALRACITAIFEVRRELPPEKTRLLLDTCEVTGSTE